jgi:hypothetical protein
MGKIERLEKQIQAKEVILTDLQASMKNIGYTDYYSRLLAICIELNNLKYKLKEARARKEAYLKSQHEKAREETNKAFKESWPNGGIFSHKDAERIYNGCWASRPVGKTTFAIDMQFSSQKYLEWLRSTDDKPYVAVYASPGETTEVTMTKKKINLDNGAKITLESFDYDVNGLEKTKLDSLLTRFSEKMEGIRRNIEKEDKLFSLKNQLKELEVDRTVNLKNLEKIKTQIEDVITKINDLEQEPKNEPDASEYPFIVPEKCIYQTEYKIYLGHSGFNNNLNKSMFIHRINNGVSTDTYATFIYPGKIQGSAYQKALLNHLKPTVNSDIDNTFYQHMLDNGYKSPKELYKFYYACKKHIDLNLETTIEVKI